VVITHGGIMRQLLHLTADGDELPTRVSFGNVACHLISIEEAGWVYSGSL
jgi:hypothetical protein